MRKNLSLMLFLFAASSSSTASSALAAWSSLVSMGSAAVIADVSCATPGSGSVVCAARGLQNTLAVNRFNGTAWTGWSVIAGAVTSSPSCADDGAGKIVCAARNAASGIAATVFNGTSFSPLIASPGGQITSAPSCAALAAGKVVCAARSAGGVLTASVFDGASWGPFVNLNRFAFSPPSCAPDRAGNAICAFLGDLTTHPAPDWYEANTLAARFNGTAWTAPLDLEGEATADGPACVELGAAGKVMCVAHATNNQIYARLFKGGSWSIANWGAWDPLGFGAQGKIGCGPLGASKVICAVQATGDSNLWTRFFDGVSWSPGWEKVANKAILGTPACTKLTPGKSLCAVTAVNNRALSATGP